MVLQQPHIDVIDREQIGVEAVLNRLVQQFPQLEPTTVHAVVEDAHKHVTGRIRDFVPIFVERRSRERLRELVHAA